MDKWERWVGPRRRAKMMTMSFRKGGHIGLGVGTVYGAKLEVNPYAELFFDQEKRQVGVKFLPDASDSCFQLHMRRGQAVIFAKPFLDYHNIPYDRARAHRLTWSASEGLFVTDRLEEVS